MLASSPDVGGEGGSTRLRLMGLRDGGGGVKYGSGAPVIQYLIRVLRHMHSRIWFRLRQSTGICIPLRDLWGGVLGSWGAACLVFFKQWPNPKTLCRLYLACSSASISSTR